MLLKSIIFDCYPYKKHTSYLFGKAVTHDKFGGVFLVKKLNWFFIITCYPTHIYDEFSSSELKYKATKGYRWSHHISYLKSTSYLILSSSFNLFQPSWPCRENNSFAIMISTAYVSEVPYKRASVFWDSVSFSGRFTLGTTCPWETDSRTAHCQQRPSTLRTGRLVNLMRDWPTLLIADNVDTVWGSVAFLTYTA